MKFFKHALKRVIPTRLLSARSAFINARRRKEFAALDVEAAFTRIYHQNLWGEATGPGERFCSGDGSRDALVVETYVSAVSAYLQSLGAKPNVVDLGCGDFSVGSRIRPYADRYIACDIVRPLIEFNRSRFETLGVDFRVCNIIEDEIPSGDIVFVRQVLQHLSNEQISTLLPRLTARFPVIVVTEHLPSSASFVANQDKSAGPDIRLTAADGPSGVVLTAPPFNLKPSAQRQLCEVLVEDGRIQTLLLEV